MIGFRWMRLNRAPHCFTRLLICAVCLVAVSRPARAAERSRIQVTDYIIDADLAPKTHHITAKAKVKFTALDDISTAVFELNNALRVTRVTSEVGRLLPTERVTQDFTVRVSLPEGMSKNQSQTITFDYEGVLNTADDSPVEGLKLAFIGDGNNVANSLMLTAGRLGVHIAVASPKGYEPKPGMVETARRAGT